MATAFCKLTAGIRKGSKTTACSRVHCCGISSALSLDASLGPGLWFSEPLCVTVSAESGSFLPPGPARPPAPQSWRTLQQRDQQPERFTPPTRRGVFWTPQKVGLQRAGCTDKTSKQSDSL